MKVSPYGQPAPRRRRGFTLVELLVVIGIIALLIGILLPALNSARKQAASVKCLSALREIGMAFHLYANFYKDAFPVVRQDTPDDGTNGPPAGTGPQNSVNRYYTDLILPFLAKNGKMNFEVGTDRLAFEQTRKSVLWGCPEWEGWQGTGSTYVNGISVFDNGYSMNFFPTFTPTYPAGAALPPGTQTQMRTTVFSFGGTPATGKYFKRSQWTKPAERLLMVDATLWYLGFFPTTSTTLPPQQVGRVAASGTGFNNIDRYRHGKYPPIQGAFYSQRGGKVAFNALFVDGHATTLHDIREGYKAIRMKYPGP